MELIVLSVQSCFTLTDLSYERKIPFQLGEERFPNLFLALTKIPFAVGYILNSQAIIRIDTISTGAIASWPIPVWTISSATGFNSQKPS